MPELNIIEVIICIYFEKDRPYGSARTHCTTDSTELLEFYVFRPEVLAK